MTDRLLMRRWRDDDADAMATVNRDPEVMRWIADGSVQDRGQTAERIAGWEQHWEEHGYGLFALTVRETGALIGFTGLATPTFLPEILPSVEIGWRLGRAHWGRGLATEAALAVRDHAFAELGLARLVSIHQVGNDASAHVMHKLGMSLERGTVEPRSGRRVHVYELLA
jgi:RimJ/RimL family protein N-acetyltransferase